MEERKQIKRPSFWHRPSSSRCSISWECRGKFPQRPFIFNKEMTNPSHWKGWWATPTWTMRWRKLYCVWSPRWLNFVSSLQKQERKISFWRKHLANWLQIGTSTPSSPHCAPITLALKPHIAQWYPWSSCFVMESFVGERVPKEKGEMRTVASLPQLMPQPSLGAMGVGVATGNLRNFSKSIFETLAKEWVPDTDIIFMGEFLRFWESKGQKLEEKKGLSMHLDLLKRHMTKYSREQERGPFSPILH